MAAGEPSRKRRFRRQKPSEAHQAGQGTPSGAEPSDGQENALLPHGTGDDAERGPGASLEAAHPAGPTAGARRLEAVRHGVARGGAGAVAGLTRTGRGARTGLVRTREGAKAALGHLADRLIENAPRVPVRDLATLRRQFPGLGPEQLADKLVSGAANATSTIGAGIGAAAMMPVPPAMPTELAAEVAGVGAIELKLIAELHEVYGLRPPGNLKDRSVAYLNSWSTERGIDVTKPSTYDMSMGSHFKRQLRQQIMKRMVRNLPNLIPFMVGAAVGAVMNRRDTRKLAHHIRADLRRRQVPWDALEGLPALEQPSDALPPELLEGRPPLPPRH
ncbi:hypothetical protein [Streptomyces genisteinicus]|uniref:EcsC family protein n=1 Tax=Streptomyces genisteinicus TaxID=2768068 RepID=A0A7H0HYW1_9ACTN|nr:hypothetical protein [Streptomyces genisteinicus]QNP65727.1 hypothetical protein IAG43_24195 [Streptomyces genisteinicus]